MRRSAMLLLLLSTLPCSLSRAEEFTTLTELGRAFFSDTRLSEPPGQACATCHDPDHAFTDPRENGVLGAVSLGADGHSLGDRNAPTLTYLSTVPPLHRTEDHYLGGFFMDGRAATLEAQVLAPFLDLREMGLPGKSALADRVLSFEPYRAALNSLLGKAAAGGGNATVAAVTRAVAAFERTAFFSTFDSKFDRYLAGEYTMTRDEAIGRELFFSNLINCSQCHLNDPQRISPRETFTNHRYHNIGIPINTRIRTGNGRPADYRDPGLAEHLSENSKDDALGKFRVPGLRNVAVTAPYMHNGIFRTLEAAVLFYGKYILTNRPAQTNPETGLAWGAPEIPENIDRTILEDGQPIDAWRVQHLVAFLKTLTDRRYEHLLD